MKTAREWAEHYVMLAIARKSEDMGLIAEVIQSAIDHAKAEERERIAKEIEAGRMYNMIEWHQMEGIAEAIREGK